MRRLFSGLRGPAARLAATSLLALLSVGRADASFLQFDFAGSLWSVNENVEEIVPFHAGTQFTGNFSWNDQTGLYSLMWNIGGNLFQSVDQPLVLVENGSFDAFQVYAYSPSLPAGWSTSGGDGPFIQFYLRDDSGTAFTSTTLPTSLDVSDFSQTSIGFYYTPNLQSAATLTTQLGDVTAYPGSNIAFQGRIETITPCEPFPGGGSTAGCFPGPPPFPAAEPGSLALLGVGLAVFAAFGCRARAHRGTKKG